MPALLTRTTFEMSRSLEFFTERELQMQIGFPRWQWLVALTKELLDNGLDACETAGVAPALTVHLDRAQGWLRVEDNGPGLPEETLRRSLDYLIRVSDKAHYVSPSRGQLGNALKCVWAAAYVLSRGQRGYVEVETNGRQYQIDVTLDALAQQPRVSLAMQEGAKRKTGTAITFHCPEIASFLSPCESGAFYHPRGLVQGYALFNPHGSFAYSGVQTESWLAADPAWAKWLPHRPTSPHWYSPERFQQLLNAYLLADRRSGRRRTVREVIAEFDGLSGVKARQAVAVEAGLHRATLEDLVQPQGLDPRAITTLLHAMQARARVLKPEMLGIIGQTHLAQRLTDHYGIDPDTFSYRCVKDLDGGLPYVLEVACGWGDPETCSGWRLCGYNHAPALRTPFAPLDALCDKAEIDAEDPVTLVVHLACPRLDATDRGKTAVALTGPIEAAMQTAIERVTKDWTKLKRKYRQEGRKALREEQERRKSRAMSVKEAAWQIMEAAYLKASDQGRLPANARQIMYAARPEIIALTGKPQPWAKSAYFTQTLLPEFMREYPELTADWDVVFDARGHFREPHTGRLLGIGTLEVRDYIAAWRKDLALDVADLEVPHAVPTVGPSHRYQYALFVEKEGFNPLLERAEIEARYGVALMSTKGMTVTAARALIEELSAAGVTILVVHDFDKSGIEILDKFTANTRRYQYMRRPRVIDLGLRLEAALAMGLESEQQSYGKGTDPRESLRRCGATAAECAFLVHERRWEDEVWEGERIELNAMTSDQFLQWLEAGLQAHGVEKVVPNDETLAKAYAYQQRVRRLQDAIDRALQDDTTPTDAPPDDLAAQIRERIADTTLSWDEGLWDILGTSERFDAHPPH